MIPVFLDFSLYFLGYNAGSAYAFCLGIVFFISWFKKDRVCLRKTGLIYFPLGAIFNNTFHSSWLYPFPIFWVGGCYGDEIGLFGVLGRAGAVCFSLFWFLVYFTRAKRKHFFTYIFIIHLCYCKLPKRDWSLLFLPIPSGSS